MIGLTAATFLSLSNWENVSKRLGCRLPVLMRGLHPDRQRAEGATETRKTIEANTPTADTRRRFQQPLNCTT
jgi:hypothetical protein